jgi:uncharacterized membrane protein YbhN (UPF0104 family)
MTESPERHRRRRGAALPAEATGARPGPGSVFLKVASAALSGGLIVLLFVAIIPNLTELGSVGESIKSMRPVTVVGSVVVAIAIRVVLAASYAALTPGLSLWRSLIAREASSAVSNVIPGPSGTAAQFAILRSWGVSLERFARATVAVSVSTDVLILAGPGIFFVIWTLVGQPAATGGHHTWAFGLAAVLLSVLSVLIVAAIGGSVRLAEGLGNACQACVNPFRRLFEKPRITTWGARCIGLRADLLDALRRDGVGLLACVIGGYGLNAILLVACIRACGVSGAALPLTLGLMLYAVGRIATIVQITPGGVGITEIAYTSVFVAALGDAAKPSIVAGVLVYRALTYALPIITGAFAYVIWRIMRHHETHEEKMPGAR